MRVLPVLPFVLGSTILLSPNLDGICPLACKYLTSLADAMACQQALLSGWDYECHGMVHYAIDVIDYGFGVACRAASSKRTYYTLYIAALQDAMGIIAANISGIWRNPRSCILKRGVQHDDTPDPEHLCGMQDLPGTQVYIAHKGDKVKMPSDMFDLVYLVSEDDACDEMIPETEIHVRAVGEFELAVPISDWSQDSSWVATDDSSEDDTGSDNVN